MKWFDLKGIDVVLNKLGKLKAEIAAGKIPFLLAADLKTMIELRTKRGSGINGTFDDYSIKPYYRAKKERPIGKGGRRTTKAGKPMQSIFYEDGYKQFAQLTKGHDTPNLFASGAMLRSLQPVTVSKDTAKLLFTRQKEAFKAMHVNNQRRFMGAMAAEKTKLQNNFAEMINLLTKRMGLT